MMPSFELSERLKPLTQVDHYLSLAHRAGTLAPKNRVASGDP